MGGYAGVPSREEISRLALLLAGNKAAMGDEEEMPGAAALSPRAPAGDGGSSVPMDPGWKGAGQDNTMVGGFPLYPGASAGGGTAPNTEATTSPAPSAQPAPAVIVPTVRPLPSPPVAPVIDTAARQKLATPTDPNVVKPKWYDRLLGGMTTFGAAMQHNPNAMELGTDIVNRRYSTAEAQRQKQLSAFDADAAAKKENYQGSVEDFNNQMKSAEEERRRTSATALDTERRAKANRADYLSMSPEERAAQVASLEKASGMTFTQAQKADFVLTGKVPAAANKADGPRGIQDALFSDDPKVRDRAEKLFKFEHRDKVADRPEKAKSGTPKQFADLDAAHGKANNQIDAAFKEANRVAVRIADQDKRIAAMSQAVKDRNEARQKADEDYQTRLADLGGKPAGAAHAKPAGTAAAAAPAKAAANPSPAAGPKQGDVRTYKGAAYSFDGKEWVAQRKK